MYARYLKRMIDFILALIILLIIWPILLILWLLVVLNLGAPAIFTQERPGLHEKVFKLYKFRSMTNEKDENGNLLPDEKRLTKFGKALRSTSLDELPEIINILKGDMSFVGPRPLLVQYLPLYNEEQKHRHDVRPGLTGLAQINGRNILSWEERFKFDVEYVQTVSLLNDLKIIFKTVKLVITKKGISPSQNVTMEYFTGSKEKMDE